MDGTWLRFISLSRWRLPRGRFYFGFPYEGISVCRRVPVLIGAGISLFGTVARDIPLKHIATRQYASGLVQSEYELGT
jgi:hypothetical protein